MPLKLPIGPKPIKLLGPPPPPEPPKPPLEEWEKKATEHMELAQAGEQRLQQLAAEAERLQRPPDWVPEWLHWKSGIGYAAWGPWSQPALLARLKPQIEIVEAGLERDDFYSRLYGQAPIVIAGGRAADPEEILALLQPPPGIPADELDEVRNTITGMVETLVEGIPPLPEMALEAELPELPELVAPTGITGVPTTINKLTIAAIIKALTAPKIPPSIMSEDEWIDFMIESGQISDKADLEKVEFMEDQADTIIAEWQERNNMLEAFRAGIAEMPEYGLIELGKEMVIQPGLALLEIAGQYFEHVSMPLAGAVYKTFIPDIEVEYQRLKKTEGTWQALGHAWLEWDSPGEGAAEWILKYMLMEGLVDPITYVGWGIAARITRPLGPIGRWVGAAERGISQVFELPFDLVKASIRKLPKTVGQQATISMHKAGQYVDKFMTRRYGKALYQMTMKEWSDGAEFAVKHTLKHPQVDNDITRAGTELLKHKPVTEKEVLDWAERLNTTLRPEDITKQTIEAVDRTFEDFFSKIGGSKKLITNQEAADELVRTLYGSMDPNMSKIAGKILLERSRQIVNGAMSFNKLRTPFQAIRQLMRRNYRLHIAIDESTTALARKEMGSVATLLDDIPIRIQKVWQNGIDKWIVRPFAESYLTFALYGPMNVIEDVIRTALAGVTPGRKSPQAFARKWAGTSYDQDLMRDAVSETYGYLRARPEGELNNWILQLGGLAKGFGDRVYGALVRYPGHIGIGMRRNFVDGRASQILKELGGETYERLARVGPEKLAGVTNRKITKEVQQAATHLKVQGQPEGIRALKGDFTRAKIIRREVDNILKEHPDLPTPVRDYIMRSYDDGIMFREAGTSIDNVAKEANTVMVDDFIASPERASTQFEQLADMLTQLEVRNPQEMAQLMQSLNLMSSVYGATPKQILGRAVERTRGLPFVERRLSIDKALDSITIFRERAGTSMDKVVERIKLTMTKPKEMVDWGRVTFSGASVDEITNIKGMVSKLPVRIKAQIKEIQVYTKQTYPKKGAVAWFTPEVDKIGFRSSVDITTENLYHELAHVHWEQTMVKEPGIVDSFAVSMNKDGIFDEFVKGESYITHRKVMEEFARDFPVYVTSPERLSKNIRSFFGEWFPKTQRDLGYSPQYISKAEHFFNLQTAKRIRGSELGEEISAWRHQFFAEVDPKALHTNEFWDDFDREIIARHHAGNVEMADFDGMIKSAIDDLNVAGGLPARQRPPIKAVDRELAPNDVAQLIGARGDDVSRSLLDTLTTQNDRDMFTSYVMAHVKPDDVGFSKESVGRVYDQIVNSLQIPPEKMSWLAGRQVELEAVRRDFHALYNSKMLPDEEIANIGRYLDNTASAVEKELYEQVRVPGKPVTTDVMARDIWNVMDAVERKVWLRQAELPEGLSKRVWKNLSKADRDVIIGVRADIQAVPPTFVRGKLKPEFEGYNDLRQQAMDEAHKWYYKEFTDYSNANSFDAIMKAIYPFWTYESQRWFWLPRSFVRHPGTFTAFERWQNNTDYGYIHIPGTSADIGIGRGTIYGTLQTRLTRRDFPEYYDSLGAAGDVIEFSDFLSRYGFYPGAHIGVPLAVFGGVEMQFGEAMPAIVKTPLDALIGMFPESESVKWISERLFGDRFRNYMTILTVNRLGGDGTLIFSKQKEGVALEPEEQQIWDDARRQVGWYSAGFEQFALFRFRTDEQYKMYEEASKVIEEMTGYTRDQQDWLRKHGYRLWDMVGGMSPTEQAILQELDYYRWVGNVRPLLPGRQQEILNKIELGWNAVEKYGETVQENKLQLQRDFLTGARGPDDYNRQLLDLYDKQGEFIDNKIKEYPLMDLDNRADYYREFNIPQPVLHPFKELLNLYFSIELKEITEPETGEKVRDWDNFWALRQAIEDAIPDDYKQEWEDFLAKNSTRMEGVRREVYHNYFRTYNKVWEKILSTYPDNEQAMIEEYLHLERTGQKLDRQAEIKATKSEKTGNMLISSFRSEASGAKKALRYHNPSLDAWLYYWGRTSTFTSPTGEEVYRQLARDTGRHI